MPVSVKKMPINSPPYADVPEVGLSSLSAALINGFIYPLKEDNKFLTMNRPGLSSTVFCDLGVALAVDGLWWWPSKKYVLAACGGNLYKINSSGTATQISGVALTAGRTNFCQAGIGGPYAFMASGGLLAYTDGSTLMNPLGLGVPTSSTHVTYMDNYIIANEMGTNQFKWSDPGVISADVVTGTDSNNYMCTANHIASGTSGLWTMDFINGTLDPTGKQILTPPIGKNGWAVVSSVSISSGSFAGGDAAGTLTISNWNGLLFASGAGTHLYYMTGGLQLWPFAQGITQPVTTSGSSSDQPITGGAWQSYWQLTTAAANKTWTSGDSYVAGWSGINLANLEAKGDVLMALDSRFDEIILFGKNSTEYWYNDGVSPFSKYEGTTSESGTIAIYSPIFDGNQHWMLDVDRNLVRMLNRAPNVVSNPFASLLQALGTVDDCFSTAIKCDGRNFLVLTFPTSNLTLAYDVESNGWQGQWGSWDAGTASFNRWLVNSYCKCPEWGFDLVGDRRTGKIYKISRQYATDAELPLRIVKRTGWNDYGIKYQKRSNRIRISLQRGTALPGTYSLAVTFTNGVFDPTGLQITQPNADLASIPIATVLSVTLTSGSFAAATAAGTLNLSSWNGINFSLGDLIYYANGLTLDPVAVITAQPTSLAPEPLFTIKSRRDGDQVWGDERAGSLGKQADTNPIVEFRQNGIFRSRQDEYVFYDAVPLTIVDGEEEIEVLSR